MARNDGPIYLNGKFMGQFTTGVQRFARNIVVSFDSFLADRPIDRDVILLLPQRAPFIVGLKHIKQVHIGPSFLPNTVWEQTVLPFHSRNGLLVCLSGSAPLLSRHIIPTIHDAAVFRYPDAYSALFRFWYRNLFKSLARRCKVVLTVSCTSANDLSRHIPIRDVFVINNSAEHVLATPCDESILVRNSLQGEPYILAVGSNNQTKNFSVLLRAFKKSKSYQNHKLVIVGKTDASVFAASDAQEKDDRVIFVGPVSDGQLRSLYSNATIFAFPSVYEGFGIPPLEAMTCGCPVIASMASAIPEVCGNAALYFDPLSMGSIASAIDHACESEQTRAGLIQKGYVRSQHFTWKRSAEEFGRAIRHYLAT